MLLPYEWTLPVNRYRKSTAVPCFRRWHKVKCEVAAGMSIGQIIMSQSYRDLLVMGLLLQRHGAYKWLISWSCYLRQNNHGEHRGEGVERERKTATSPAVQASFVTESIRYDTKRQEPKTCQISNLMYGQHMAVGYQSTVRVCE